MQRADSSIATVVGVRSVPGSAAMWDLTVSTLHDFAVGNGAYVVHNCGANGKPDATKLGDGQDYYYEGQRREGLKQQGWREVKKPVIKANHSQAFRDFIMSHRPAGYVFDDSKWAYNMETWQRGNTIYDNHYWEDVAEEEVWHHHYSWEFNVP